MSTTELDRAIALTDDAADRIGDAESIVAGIQELVERVNAGRINRDDRTDIGGDLLAALERLNNYAVQVLG